LEGKPLRLNFNCRNTKKITAHCGEIIETEIASHEHALPGEAPEVIYCRNFSDLIDKAKNLVNIWCGKEQVDYGEIAILAGTNEKLNDWPDTLRGIPLTDDYQLWRRGGGVLKQTHRRFKGLEASIVILADYPAIGTQQWWTKNDAYVACSRAKHKLVLLEINK
jgi:DNA helicase IV